MKKGKIRENVTALFFSRLSFNIDTDTEVLLSALFQLGKWVLKSCVELMKYDCRE